MDSKTWGSVQFLVTNVALEVFGFLVENQHLFVVEFSVTVPTNTGASQGKHIHVLASDISVVGTKLYLLKAHQQLKHFVCF